MNQTHSRTPCQQVQWVSTLLAQRGSYGVVTMASQELGVARQTLYRWRRKDRPHWRRPLRLCSTQQTAPVCWSGRS